LGVGQQKYTFSFSLLVFPQIEKYLWSMGAFPRTGALRHLHKKSIPGQSGINNKDCEHIKDVNGCCILK
jgi:hypothetical protein